MNKQEKQDLVDEVRTWVIRGVIAAVVAPIIGLIISAIAFVIFTPSSLDAHQQAITCNTESIISLQENIVTIRNDMGKNQREILNILREDYEVR